MQSLSLQQASLPEGAVRCRHQHAGGHHQLAGRMRPVGDLRGVLYRRRFFELFYKTHILGLITFFLFGYMHHVSLWAYTMPGAPPAFP